MYKLFQCIAFSLIIACVSAMLAFTYVCVCVCTNKKFDLGLEGIKRKSMDNAFRKTLI
jgi:hypothetical protein